jgi:hypothetical protein
MAKSGRNSLYTLLQVGKADLHMSEGDYRKLLAKHGARLDSRQRYSASTMTIKGLLDALDEMKAQGFVPTGAVRYGADTWRTRRIKKITAIWCALAEAGVVHERGYQSMERWCRSLIKTPKLEWATGIGLNNCIEGLKSWAAREGVKLDDC